MRDTSIIIEIDESLEKSTNPKNKPAIKMLDNDE
jgi:hypothetical protein